MKRIQSVLLFTLTVSFFLFSIPVVQAQVPKIPAGSLKTSVQASVGEFYLDLYGYASPYASIVLSSDGVFLRSTVADANGNFSFLGVLVKSGLSSLSFDTIDFARLGESTTSLNISPVEASRTIRDIFLPPTLGLSRTTVNEGGSATAFGYTMPNAKVTLHINNELLTTTADVNGYYEFALSNLKAGNYSLYATANYKQKESLSPTKKLKLESISKPKQVANLVGNWWEQLLRFLKNWFWNPLWLVIPILILIIILIRKLWGRRFINPFKREKHPLHHSWWMGY